MDIKEELDERRKLINVLYEFTKENFSMSDYTILDKLFDQIAAKASNKDFIEIFRDFAVWLACVVNLWNSNNLTSSVKVFAMRLFGLIGSTPFGFTAIKHMLPHIDGLFSNPIAYGDDKLIVLLMKDIGNFINHKDGLDWMLKSGFWKNLVRTVEDTRPFIHCSGIKFTSLLLNKVKDNSEQVMDILKLVCGPILCKCEQEQSTSYSIVFTLPFDNSNLVVGQISYLDRAVKNLCKVLDELFAIDSDLPVKFKYTIPEDITAKNCLGIQDGQVIYQLAVMLDLFKIANENKDFPKCHMGHLYSVVYIGYDTLSSLRQFNGIMNFSVFCLARVHRLRTKTAICSVIGCKDCPDWEKNIFSKLTFFLHLHSACFCGIHDINIYTNLHMNCKPPKEMYRDNDGFWKPFFETHKCGPSKIKYFQPGVAAFVQAMKFTHFPESLEYQSWQITACLNSLVCHYKLDDRQKFRRTFLQLLSVCHHYPYLNIHAMLDLINDFFATVEDEPQVIIPTINVLTKILIEQVPLLMFELERNDDFGFGEELERFNLRFTFNSSFLMKHLHFKDPISWEIQDTVLEYFRSAVEVSDMAPSFLRGILSENLFRTILEMAANHSSYYVRTSALRVLTKAIASKNYADNLPHKDQSDLALNMLLHDVHPNPRAAACDLLSALYITDRLKEMHEELFDIMYKSSTKELDWEVKKALLNFWQCTITKHLADEGVCVDAVYVPTMPTTACNGEVDKIIKAMDALSAIGCFKVVWLDLMDDSEITVSEAASDVVNSFLNLDKRWNYIDEILNNPTANQRKNELTNSKYFSKEDFFRNIRHSDWKRKVEGRKIWIRESCDDMASLMDHIMSSNREDWDFNAVDCY